MGRRRWIGLIVGSIGVLLFIGSFVWRAVAVPALVRFPTDLDVTPEYTGSVTLYIDPATHLPLAEPKKYDLHVVRNLEADGEESSKDLVVIDETLHLTAAGLFDFDQQNQYVMDRRSMENVKDPRSWAFTPDNVVDRSPNYRLNFPFDTKSQPYPVYKNEIATSYEARPTGKTTEIEGVTAKDFEADSGGAKPVTAAYLASLDQAVKLPRSLSLDELKPILASAGFDVDASLPGLLGALSPEDAATVAQLATGSIDLAYQLEFTGTDSVDTYTGAPMEIRDVTETLTARPTGDAVTTLQSILEKYPDNTEAKAGLGAIKSLDENPIAVFENSYSQTPASVRDIAGDVKHQRDQRRLAEKTLPLLLLIIGAVLAIGGALLAWRGGRRRHPNADSDATATPDSAAAGAPPVPEPEPAPLTADPPGTSDAPSPVDEAGSHDGSIGLDTAAVNDDENPLGGADSPARPES
jgi:hypothetical protein